MSPVPRSFIELQVNLISSEFDGPTLKSLEIEFFDPIAAGALAEISPTVVVAGVETEFTYSLFPGGLRDGGFDRIEVESSAEMSFVSIRVGESVSGATPVKPVPTWTAKAAASACLRLHLYWQRFVCPHPSSPPTATE